MYPNSKLIQRSVYYSLNIFGIFNNFKYTSQYVIGCTCFLIIFIIGSTVGIITCPGISDKLLVLSVITSEISALCIYIDVFSKRKKLMALLTKMKNYGAPPAYILSKAEIIMRKELLKYILGMAASALSSTVPSTLDSLQDKPITPKYSLIVPYWFSCDDYNRTNVILRTLFCIRVQTRIQLLLYNSLQASMGLSMYMIACAGVILYSAIVYELWVHVDIFKSMVRNLSYIMNQYNEKKGKWASRTYHLKANASYERTINSEFVAIIKYQQFLKSCIIDIVDMWNIFCSIYIVNYFFTVAILLFITLTEREDALLLALKTASLGIFSYIGFYLNCLYGYFISNMNEIVFDEICTIPWYEQSIKFRKLYAIVLAQNRKSYRMKVANMVNVDLITLIALIRTTFSVLNLMLAINRSDSL